jgi:hypothetical protein
VQGDDDRDEDEDSAEFLAPGELLAEEHDAGQHGDDDRRRDVLRGAPGFPASPVRNDPNPRPASWQTARQIKRG